MPELPEVESLRRSLLPFICGKTISSAEVLQPKIVSSKGNKRVALSEKKVEFEQGVSGEKILNIRRRAKNLVFELSGGKQILVHLKMTGQLVFQNKKEKIYGGHPIDIFSSSLPGKHTRIIFHLSDGTLFYNDTRMFGYVLYYESPEQFEHEQHFSHLGLEPDDPAFTLEYLSEKLRSSSGRLKSVLMEQKIVVGLGNIYCDEVCFFAGVKPSRFCRSLKKSEIKKLHEGVNVILSRAIELGGSSISAYLLADGSRGNYAREHKVYGRAGKPCLQCGTALKKTVIHGRTTVYCSHCQK